MKRILIKIHFFLIRLFQVIRSFFRLIILLLMSLYYLTIIAIKKKRCRRRFRRELKKQQLTKEEINFLWRSYERSLPFETLLSTVQKFRG